jgi:hypothetical protein
MITLELAHPLSAAQAERLRAKDVKDYPTPGMEITLPVDDARSLIGSGYAKDVEPTDAAAVQEALSGKSKSSAKK